jgi:hypothetical protein
MFYGDFARRRRVGAVELAEGGQLDDPAAFIARMRPEIAGDGDRPGQHPASIAASDRASDRE